MYFICSRRNPKTTINKSRCTNLYSCYGWKIKWSWLYCSWIRRCRRPNFWNKINMCHWGRTFLAILEQKRIIKISWPFRYVTCPFFVRLPKFCQNFLWNKKESKISIKLILDPFFLISYLQLLLFCFSLLLLFWLFLLLFWLLFLFSLFFFDMKSTSIQVSFIFWSIRI